ncbi:hypothetical protein [Rhodococcoides trifolii]|uniref:hypothetical protein n=1 Tax=Rhodococcoides trifolii TaxID=908250 RepID=UPI00166985C5|nr:hypothetical protein [Rhodococcus trifolii]
MTRWVVRAAFGSVFAVLVVLTAVRGVFYPAVVRDGSYATSWGGPTLVGAWAVHLLIGVVSCAVVGIVGRRVDRRIGRR